MSILLWIILGFIAGTLAKMITPQKEKGGWISSIIVGLIGAILGGFLVENVLNISTGKILSLPNILAALGGSIIVLYIWRAIKRKRSA